ncbi:helicase-related protein, partial [Aneurinibacillus sp. UBA3580]|uniref:helicase-related protein n=1 Tax=Aneurinibacillus sp. UBA3580 TaxID=1946041 RepID=UPI00257BC8DB
LLNGVLHDAIMKAAGKGFINRLVVDEAHIVIDWGNLFRTEFQFLSAWRKRLLQESRGRLKTVLLSATITDWAAEMLRDMFAEPGRYIEVRGDELRSEPTYLLDTSRNDEERYQKITDNIHLLPKPLILYVSTREHAQEWYDRLRKKGYRSVERFTSDTQGELRRTLVRQWNEDEIDIMVATSAFGMGVDKKEIRTIVHCCMPESINRFYQEVGRAGRDGLASLSLFSFVPEDEEIARSLMKSAVITTEKLVGRWDSLFQQASRTDVADEYWVRMNIQPRNLEGTRSGKRNENWNESLLLLLYRHKFIDILKVEQMEGQSRRVLIKVLDYQTINSPDLLYNAVEPYREKERNRINEELREMRQLIAQADSKCFSSFFCKMYHHAQPVCSGCPHCRKVQNDAMYVKSDIFISCPKSTAQEPPAVCGPLADYIWGTNEALLSGTEQQRCDPEAVAHLVNRLIEANVSLFIVPDMAAEERKRMICRLPGEEADFYYTLLTYSERQSPLHFLQGHAAVFYSGNPARDSRLYRWAQDYQHLHADAVIIHIGEPELFIQDEGRTLAHLVNTVPYRIDDYLSQQDDEFEIKLL